MKTTKKTGKTVKQKAKIQTVEEIRASMGRVAVKADYGVLDLGDVEINQVLGREEGIPWGMMIELYGPNSQGKTAVAMDCAAAAQADGAFVIWLDSENSFETKHPQGKVPWPVKRGLNIDPDNFGLIQPYIIEKTGEMCNAEHLLQETETMMKQRARKRRVFLVLDSVNALVPKKQADEDISVGMVSNLALSSLLSTLLRRWVALFGTLGITGIFINQIRTNPGQRFGNPEYTPGGNALPFYAQVRARIKRQGESRGRMLKNGRAIGIKSLLVNIKNKSGGAEGAECGYKIFFSGKAIIVPASEIKTKDLD